MSVFEINPNVFRPNIVNRFSKLTAKKILNVGLHEFLLRFIRDLYSVNSNLQNNYFFGKEK